MLCVISNQIEGLKSWQMGLLLAVCPGLFINRHLEFRFNCIPFIFESLWNKAKWEFFKIGNVEYKFSHFLVLCSFNWVHHYIVGMKGWNWDASQIANFFHHIYDSGVHYHWLWQLDSLPSTCESKVYPVLYCRAYPIDITLI